MGYVVLIAYVATIFAANWFIGHVGTCVPDGPCLVPVGFGLEAPSGVLWIGAALFLRDGVQQTLGRRWAIGGIVAGALLSALLSPALALASGAAFLLGEASDMAVYTPLRQRGRVVAAILASGTVGSVVDSALFLWLAFGSLDFLAGQVAGKWEMTLLAAVGVWVWSRRDLRVAV